MTKLKEKIHTIINSSNLPFLIFFVVLIMFHLIINGQFGDDLFFGTVVSDEKNILQFLKERYNTWSSRLIIELVLVSISKSNLIIWKIFNIIIYLLLAKSISKICLAENNKLLNYIICGMLLMFPIPVLNNTGWVATTTNYLWVASLGVFSMSIIIEYIKEIKIPIWKYILYIITMLYASNQEQMAVVMFLVFGVFLLYQLIKNKLNYILKKQKFLIFAFILTIVSLIFILTCPGNIVRKEAEVKSWYPEYTTFNFIEKIELGLTSTMKILILETNTIFIIFTLMVFIGVCIIEKNKIYKILSFIPFASSIFYTFFINHIMLILPKVFKIIQRFMQLGLIMDLNSISIVNLSVIIMYVCIILLILFSIYRIFKKDIKMYICIRNIYIRNDYKIYYEFFSNNFCIWRKNMFISLCIICNVYCNCFK